MGKGKAFYLKILCVVSAVVVLCVVAWLSPGDLDQTFESLIRTFNELAPVIIDCFTAIILFLEKLGV